MNGKRNRRHGHSWERQVCIDLREHAGIDAHRRLEYRTGSDDIEHPYQDKCSLQCKATKTLSITKELTEMVRRRPACFHHFLVVQGFRQQPFVAMPYKEFLEIMKVLKTEVWE